MAFPCAILRDNFLDAGLEADWKCKCGFPVSAHPESEPTPDREGHFSEWFARARSSNSSYAFGTTLDLIKEELERVLVSVQTRDDDMPRIMPVIAKIQAALEKAASIVPLSKIAVVRNLMRSPVPDGLWHDLGQTEKDLEEQSTSVTTSISEELKHKNKHLPNVPKTSNGALSRIPRSQGAEFRRDHFGRHWGKHPVDGGTQPQPLNDKEGTMSADLFPEFSVPTTSSEMEKYRSAFGQCMTTLRLLFTLRWVYEISRSMENDRLDDEWPTSPDLTVHPAELSYQTAIFHLWCMFGKWLSFEVVRAEEVYSSDLDRTGILDIFLKFNNQFLGVCIETKLHFAEVSYVDQFLATLLALTSGLNFDDWCWEKKYPEQKQKQKQEQEQPEPPAMLPVGLLLCPAGVMRAQFLGHTRCYIVDERPLFDEEADDAVFALLWATSVKAAEAVAAKRAIPGICRSPFQPKSEEKEGDFDGFEDSSQKDQAAFAAGKRTTTAPQKGTVSRKVKRAAELKEWPWNEFYVSQFGLESHAELQATRLALLSRWRC